MVGHDLSRMSWDAQGIAVRHGQGEIVFTPHSDDQNIAENEAGSSHIIPSLPEHNPPLGCIYLPIEQLLTRAFSFPLQHRRHLDADMLGQELADTAGTDPDAWWLSWRSDKSGQGIAGIVFGLDNRIKQAMQSQPAWQQAPLLLVDGWERLHQWMTTLEKAETLAVVDADAEGVFFGLLHDGAWQGMRRLNADMSDEASSESTAKQVVWSLQSMGMVLADTYVTGRLTPALAEVFPLAHPTAPPLVEHALPQRHMLNLMLPHPSTLDKRSAQHQLNIRHGQWAAKHTSSTAQSWRRPAMMVACLCGLWLGMTVFQNVQLAHQLDAMNDALTDAFHRGLPNQPVMIDALAQLRQAANGNSNDTTGNGAYHVTKQMESISHVFAQHPWQMQELKIDAQGVLLAGKVDTLDTLNSIRDSLEKITASSVHIADTDLKGDEVSFRIRWQ